MTTHQAKMPPAESGKTSSRRISAAAPAAAWGFSFVILRIFAVSGYDWNTSFNVSTTLSVDDGLALMFGSLMADHLLVAALLISVLPLLIATYLWSPGGHRAVVVLPTTVAIVVLLAITVSFNSWWLPLSAGVIFVGLALVRRLPATGRLSRVMAATMARVGWVGGIAVLVLAAVVQTPWVPLEQIETEQGTIAGYVLSIDSGYLNVLTDEHQYVILNRDDVQSRE